MPLREVKSGVPRHGAQDGKAGGCLDRLACRTGVGLAADPVEDETHDGQIRVEFRLGGDHAAGRALLESQQAVTEVSSGRAPGSWIVGIQAGSLAATVRALVNQDVEVIGIHRLDEDLETIYRRYFETREEVSA